MIVQFLAALLLAYTALLLLCLRLPRHFRQLLGREPSADEVRCLTRAGWLGVLLPLGPCLLAWPWGMALVGWCSVLSLSSFLLVMLMGLRPRVALYLPVAGALGWALLALVTARF